MLEKYKLMIHPSEPITYYEGLELAGLLWLPSLKNRIYTVISIAMSPLAVLHFLMKIIMDYEDLDILDMTEVIHWLGLHIICLTVGPAMVLKTRIFLQIHDIVKNGVFTYPEPLTEEQKEVLEKEAIVLRFLVKVSCFVFLLSFFGTEIKGVLSGSEWALAYPGWFPFQINNYITFTIATIFQLFMGYNLLITGLNLCVTYQCGTGHFCSQLAILNMKLTDLFRKPNSKETIMKRIAACVDHHNTLISFYILLRNFFSMQMLVMSITAGVIFCTTVYGITDPGADISILIALLTVTLPEVIVIYSYCWSGQRMADQSEMLSTSIYNTNWYEQTPEVRKYLLMILVNSTGTFKMKATGLLTYDLKGIKEIIQCTYSYFNMLSAVRKSQA